MLDVVAVAVADPGDELLVSVKSQQQKLLWKEKFCQPCWLYLFAGFNV